MAKVTVIDEAGKSIEERNLSAQQSNSGADQHPPLQAFYCIGAIHSRLTTLESRLKTFDLEWNKKAILAPEKVARAGFFYLGQSDKTKCFYCSGGIQKWDHNDDPWVEHAKWYPDCPFVWCEKGIEFALRVVVDNPHLKRQKIPNSLSCVSTAHRTTSSNDLMHWEKAVTVLNQKKIWEKLQSLGYHVNEFQQAVSRWGCDTKYRIAELVQDLLSLSAKHEISSTCCSLESVTDVEQSLGHGRRKRKRPASPKTAIPHKSGTTESDAGPSEQTGSGPEAEPESSYVYIRDTAEEICRLASFSCRPLLFHPSVCDAARDGLYYSGEGSTASCFCCGETWNISQGPYTNNLHRSDCEMMTLQLAATNIRLEFAGEVQQYLRQYRQPMPSRGERAEQRNVSPPAKRRCVFDPGHSRSSE